SAGEYRAGDQIWLRQTDEAGWNRLLNRDVLVPRAGGRFGFGRMIDHVGTRIAILPPGPGQRQLVVDSPAWLAAAEMLVRKL
ncbi:MAG: XRE family transcriptional regulator, partial [Novosphingobium sp.]